MTDVTKALKDVALVSVERTRAAAVNTKLFDFFTDVRIIAFTSFITLWIHNEERSEKKEKKTISIVGLGLLFLGLAYIFYISSSLLGEFIIHFSDALGSSGLIDALPQRVVDVNLYNFLVSLRKSLHSAAGLHENLPPKALATAFKQT